MTEQSTSKYENKYEFTLTRFEKARVLGQRAKQLSMGAPPLVNIQGLTSAIDIALKELQNNKIPIIIQRTYPNGEIKEIKVSDMYTEF
jgi:DNA-directed RNA polymerase I, II, and III subunit RPABC2